MIKLHILQHVPFETAGYFATLPQSEFTLSTTHLYNNEPLPDFSTFDLLVILGGPMNVDEHEKYRWLPDEKVFIKKAADANKKIIGICLGSQLIASALGAKVTKNNNKEIGWFKIRRTVSSQNESILSTIPEPFFAFHWHGDTFEIPHGAVHVAESDGCRNQMFIYNKRVIGLQFHLEATDAGLTSLIDNCRNELVESQFIQNETEIKHMAKELIPQTNKYLDSIIRNLIEV